MNENEFNEREYFIDQNGLIFDNSLNENLEDNQLKATKKRIKEIYDKQEQDIKEFILTRL